MTGKTLKKLSIISVIILILCLIPIFVIGFYNHPTGDDYYYGCKTYLEFNQSRNIVNVFKVAIDIVKYEYEVWQGTYSAMFLMCLAPNVFGDNVYSLFTLLHLSFFTISIFYLCQRVLSKYLNSTKAEWIIIATIISLMMIETVPSQGETFFWYNGSMYYTGFFAVSCILIGLLLKYIDTGNKFLIPLSLVLSFFIAGGNYVSLLPTMLIVLVVAFVLLIFKNKAGIVLFLNSLTIIIGLYISAKAPGNMIRQDGMYQIHPLKAIIKSLLQGIKYMRAWISFPWILAAVLMLPILLRGIKRCDFKFRYPIIVVGLAYGIFCSMSCPTFYTMNSTGPARAVSIVYYGFVLYSFFSFVYIVGYLQKNVIQDKQLFQNMKLKKINKNVVYILGIVILIIVNLLPIRIKTYTTYKSINELASGEAKLYNQEYNERLAILHNQDIKDVVFENYKVKPDMLYVGDLSPDSNEPTNVSVAEYFGKNSVRIIY